MKVKDIIKYTDWIPNPRYSEILPKFSIFMPTFRRGSSGHLERAIQSVLRQTFGEFELIIIDDASTDGSFEIIKRYMQVDSRVNCLHHPRNVGLPALSCYEAYKVSRGQYLMFCFDDTKYETDVLEKIVLYLQSRLLKIGFGYIQEIVERNGIRISHFLGKDMIPQRRLQVENFLPNMGVVIHRCVPEEIGFLDPHFGIARLSDWDYWKRAAKVYEIHRLPIYFGTEYGGTAGNSLGQTYPVNTWLAHEWSEIERNEALKPGNYEEYDIQFIPNQLSYQSQQFLLDLAQFYSNKFWYAPLELSSVTLDHGKVLVVVPDLSASTSLPFENLSKSYFWFSTFENIDLVDVINAQFVIISRDILSDAAQKLSRFLFILGIPTYYYLDDNFVILSDESKELEEYTYDNLRCHLQEFSGVLVSTPSLQNFFVEHHIHEIVHVFPPVLPSREWFDYPVIPAKAEGVFRFGVIGGFHRYRNFVDYIQPALNELAKDYRIELVVVGELPVSTQRFTTHRYPIDYSYKLTLGRLISSDIDVLIHPASFTKNNPYKTMNALINAWAIGAIPVLANQPPYEDVENKGIGYLCEPEDTSSWYEKLKTAILLQERSRQIRENLNSFLLSHYSGASNEKVIQKILSELPALGFATVQKRYQTLFTSSEAINFVKTNMIENKSTFVLTSIILKRIKRKALSALQAFLSVLMSKLR